MSNSVYAEGMGFFHQASGGKGIAPGDVCLSPPPPPGGPVPVPYVNMLQASDLAKGSSTVKIQGTPTALENASEVATSSGDEAGTQGGGVVTHKTKGKGTFKLWSFTVKVEGKGVCRHGDPMGQNEMSTPPNCMDAQAAVDFRTGLPQRLWTKCKSDYSYKEHYTATTGKQKEKVQNKACWECSRNLTNLKRKSVVDNKAVERLEKKIARQKAGKEVMRADHQPLQSVAWEMGGCNMDGNPAAFKEAMRNLKVNPHCKQHSDSQPGRARKFRRSQIWKFMREKGLTR